MQAHSNNSLNAIKSRSRNNVRREFCKSTHECTGPPGCLALASGLFGPPARWAATTNIEGGSGTVEGVEGPLSREGRLYFGKLCVGPRVHSYANAHGTGLPN